jgi:toxin YoeB
VRVLFSTDGWADYLHWTRESATIHARLNELIEDIRRHPFTGLGKPEALKGDLSGWWSRRITAEHRLVYRVAGKAHADQRVEILQCRYHY